MLGRALNAFLSIMSLGPANRSQMVTIYYSYFAHEETEAQVIHSSKVKTRICRSVFPDPSGWTSARAQLKPCRGAQETKAAGPAGRRRRAENQAAPAVPWGPARGQSR